jgi:Ca-activated chloride channel family protein
MPDLYTGEPVVLTAELPDTKPTGKLQITGKTGAQPWRVEMEIANAADGQGISKLWARRKIDDLEARAYERQDPTALDKDVETVALAHHLVSRMTSLVAVDVTASRPSDKSLDQTKLPLNLPDGWDFEKVFGDTAPAPQAPSGNGPDHAMAAPLQQVAELAETRMAAAPTPKAASLIAQRSASIQLPQTATRADEQIARGVTMMVLALVAASGLMAWRRRSATAGVSRDGN